MNIIKVSSLEQVSVGSGTSNIVNRVSIYLHLTRLGTALLVITLFLKDPSPLRTMIFIRTRRLSTMVSHRLIIKGRQNGLRTRVLKGIPINRGAYAAKMVWGINRS